MTVFQTAFTLKTPGRGLINITDRVADIVAKSQIITGTCHVFIHHTSASIVLCENADPLVQEDLERFMQRITPDGHPDFQHDHEGPDDMASHVRTILTQNFLVIPVTNQKLSLGTWQGLYVWEHRLASFERKLTVSVQGTCS